MNPKAASATRFRNLPLLLAIAGLLASQAWPGSPAAWLPLLFCPGWGLTRLLSVIDRNFGVLGASCCLSPLVLGLLVQFEAERSGNTQRCSLLIPMVTVGLCLLGRLRLHVHDRWQRRQPAHPAPMPWWPRHLGACVTFVVATLLLVLDAVPLGRAEVHAPRAVVAAEALAWSQGGEDPLRAGEALPVRLMATATAGLAQAGGLHPLVAAQLLSLVSLIACLVLAAEAISRLWGNRGGLLAMLASLLSLNPLAAAFLLGSDGMHTEPARLASGFDPHISTALAPFLQAAPMALTLAFTSMLLSSTLSVLRRSSTHVPRLVAAAAFGLVLCDPRAALLLLPAWVLGMAAAHLACRDSPDNDPQLNSGVRRAGEPAVLRSPFWRPTLHLALGGLLGYWLTGWPELQVDPSRIVLWGLVAAVGPGCVLFMPGVRHLNASPGREAYFFLLLVPAAAVLGVVLHFEGDQGELVARLLALVLAVPAANGAMKVSELYGARGALLLVTLLVLGLVGPFVVLRSVGKLARPLRVESALAVSADDLPGPLVEALRIVSERSAPRTVLLLQPGVPGLDLYASFLLSLRSLLVVPQAEPDDPRGQLVERLVASDGTALSRLRGLPGVAGRELWAVHQPPAWPGFQTEVELAGLLVERSRLPDVVLVTISSLRVDRLDGGLMPRLGERAREGLLFETAISPFPDTRAGLATLLTGLSPVEHDVRDVHRRLRGDIPGLQARLAARGYRSSAVVALEAGTGLLEGFEQVHAEPDGRVETLVDVALEQLALADSRPVFLWLHLADLELPLDVPPELRTPATGESPFPVDPDLEDTQYGAYVEPRSETGLGEVDLPTGSAQYDALVQHIDRQLGRLLQSVPESDLLAVTAPHGVSLTEHEAWFVHGPDLFEPSIHVPLVVCGGGMPKSRSASLASLADLPELLLDGRLPSRQRVLLESGWRPGLGSGRAYPPDLDPTSRGAARRIWGERTAHGKTLLTVVPAPGRDARGVSFDLTTDPDEMHATPADPFDLRRIDTWRRRGEPASLERSDTR